MYTLIKNNGKARRGQFETVHGTFQTPCFMNVGTAAAIKGGISSIDLKADYIRLADELAQKNLIRSARFWVNGKAVTELFRKY